MAERWVDDESEGRSNNFQGRSAVHKQLNTVYRPVAIGTLLLTSVHVYLANEYHTAQDTIESLTGQGKDCVKCI